MKQINLLQKATTAARLYWDIRDTGRVDDARTNAHNDLMRALSAADISFCNREHAALIGQGLIALDEALENLYELGVRLAAGVEMG